MTVARLRTELTNDEYVRWVIYYSRLNQRQQLQTLRAQAQRRR